MKTLERIIEAFNEPTTHFDELLDDLPKDGTYYTSRRCASSREKILMSAEVSPGSFDPRTFSVL
jgi:hypothetical protein